MNEQPVNRLDLLFLIQAYNRGELSLDEFIEKSRAWAEAMLRLPEGGDLRTTPEPSPR